MHTHRHNHVMVPCRAALGAFDTSKSRSAATLSSPSSFHSCCCCATIYVYARRVYYIVCMMCSVSSVCAYYCALLWQQRTEHTNIERAEDNLHRREAKRQNLLFCHWVRARVVTPNMCLGIKKSGRGLYSSMIAHDWLFCLLYIGSLDHYAIIKRIFCKSHIFYVMKPDKSVYILAYQILKCLSIIIR